MPAAKPNVNVVDAPTQQMGAMGLDAPVRGTGLEEIKEEDSEVVDAPTQMVSDGFDMPPPRRG